MAKDGRSDYTIPGLSKPATPQPAPAPTESVEEWDPEKHINRGSSSLTPEEQARLGDSLKEVQAAGEAEVAPSWNVPTEQAPEPKVVTQPLFCPNCNHNLSTPLEDIPIEDRREFLRSVLANRSFTKTYKLLNGRVSITFRARTTEVDRMIEQQLQMDLKSKRFVPAADVEWNRQYALTRISKLWLTASLVSYVPSNHGSLPEMCTEEARKAYGEDDANDTHISKAETKLFLNMPLSVFSLINASFMKFTVLMSRLTVQAESPNFWTEIDGLI